MGSIPMNTNDNMEDASDAVTVDEWMGTENSEYHISDEDDEMLIVNL